MLAAGIKTPAPLAELESHLREDMDQQIRDGISPQIAFETAVKRIGQADALKVEFEKISAAGLPRRYLCLFCFIAAPLLVFINVWALQPGEISPARRFGALATISLVALYISGLPFLYRRLPSPQNRLVQLTMWLGYVLALVWPLLGIVAALGATHLDVGIVAVMIIWALGAAWFATLLAYWVSGEVHPPAGFAIPVA
jgi:hypothetical protein